MAGRKPRLIVGGSVGMLSRRLTAQGSAQRMKECKRNPVPGRPCQAPGPHELARGAIGCVWCGEPMNASLARAKQAASIVLTTLTILAIIGVASALTMVAMVLQPRPADPVAPEPDVVAAIEAGYIGAAEPVSEYPIGAANPLPAGCEIWAVGPSGREWRVPAVRIELRSPDGPTVVGFMADGAAEVRCYGLQTLRFGAAGGVDEVIRLELAAPKVRDNDAQHDAASEDPAADPP